MGAIPGPRARQTSLRLIRVPLILCDKLGVPSLVRSFSKLEPGSISVSGKGELIAVEAVIWMSGPDAVPDIISVDLAGEAFPVRLCTQPERQATLQEALHNGHKGAPLG